MQQVLNSTSIPLKIDGYTITNKILTTNKGQNLLRNNKDEEEEL